ncbi:hypothetical protein KBD34_01955 [Patescibacteria group bacterium]|nr:hypothetical protein [Patescibacteria group bacterium]
MDPLLVEKQAQAKVLWVLNKIKHDKALSMSDAVFKYRIDTSSNPTTPTKQDQKSIIEMLVKKHAVEADPFYEVPMTLDFIAKMSGYEPVGYKITLLQAEFDTLCVAFTKTSDASVTAFSAKDGTFFDDREARLFFRDKTCQLRTSTNEHLFCREMYSHEPMTAIEQSVIYELFSGDELGDKKAMRPVYETMVRLNNKTKEELGIEILFKADGGTIKRLL